MPSYSSQFFNPEPEYSFNSYQHLPREHQQDPRHNQYYGDDLRGHHQQNQDQQLQQQQQQEQPQQQHLQLVSVDDLMNHAASTKQRQQNSKRFRTAESTQETDSFGRVVTPSYLQQKSEFEARAGNRDDESGKWLVR